MSVQQAFDVYLGKRCIDTVFATGYTEDEMRRSLIGHDGYDSRITVRLARPRAASPAVSGRTTRAARGQ
jgi:hypothetical protein